MIKVYSNIRHPQLYINKIHSTHSHLFCVSSIEKLTDSQVIWKLFDCEEEEEELQQIDSLSINFITQCSLDGS